MGLGRYADGAAQESAVCYHAPSALLQARGNAVVNAEAKRFGAQHSGRLLSREAGLRAERAASGAGRFTQTPKC